jgi:hypothetical protein
LAAADGGVFAFGDARFSGSAGGLRLAAPVSGIASSAAGGYWLVGRDGGVFSYGGAPFDGSAGGAAVGIAGAGPGYVVTDNRGGVSGFGMSSRGPVVGGFASPQALLAASLAGATKLFGVSPSGNSAGIPGVAGLAGRLGHPVQIVNIFMGWNQPLPLDSIRAISALGAVPEITWEPWPAGGGPSQPAYADAVIASGRYDAYIRQVATAARSFGGPLLLRYAHEMNGNWYPWAASVNGNTPAAYVAAWRHVHDLFSAAGASGVDWVWAPNAGGPTPVAQVWPGAAYVDVVGMDGYNWGTGTSGYQSPPSVFSSLLATVHTVAPGKPVLINETGTSEKAGNKPAWLEQLFSYVSAQPSLMGVVYSDFGNWVLDSSPQSLAGAAAGLSRY